MMRFAWNQSRKDRGVNPSASLIVFLLALIYTCFAGKFLEPFFSTWSGPLFSFGLALIPVLFALCFHLDFKRIFRLTRPGFVQTAGGLMLAAGLFLFVLLASVLLGVLFPDIPVSAKNPGINVLDKNIFRVVLSIVLMPAISEELLFRGFILSGLARSLNKKKSIVLCALLFAFLHLEPLQLPFAFLVGVGLSLVALKTGSLWIPIVMHAFHNLALLLIARGIASRGNTGYAFADFTNPSALVFAGTVGLIMVLVSFLLVRAGIHLVSNPLRGFPCGEKSIE